jgi:PAS domain S-box-containing protein
MGKAKAPILSSAHISQPVGIFLLALRMSLLSLALAVVSYIYFSTDNLAELQGKTLFVVMAILFGISALSGFSIINRKHAAWINLAELLVDGVVITGIIYVTGGAVSPLLFLYLPFLVVVAFASGRNIALSIAAFCLVLYSSLAIAMNSGLILAFADQSYYTIPAFNLNLQLAGLMFSMFLIVMASDFLRTRLLQSNDYVMRSMRMLEFLHNQQTALFDEIPTGLVLLDHSQTIVQMNRTAQNILGSNSNECIGRQFPLIWKQLTGTDWESWQQNLNQRVSAEISFCDCHTKQTVNIMLATRNIMLEHAELPGKMVLFQDVTKLRELENRLAAQDQIAQLLTSPNSPQILKSSQLDKFVGQSSAMINLLDSIRRLTNSKANVLITGESGTGKELIAKALHYEGDLAEKPFVAVNCGAIPAELIESQLFGHKKGSFTGAISDHKGFFEQANGGTIFLDEIGELPLAMQTKLLRVIQERIIRPIGAEKEIAIDVRIVAATNRDLNKDVSSGAFREDLLYRINVVHLVLPPLRERREDIPLLVKGILNKLVPAGEELPLVSPAALKLLLEHSYPGNIRELENILERAYVFNSQAILPENLKLEVTHNGKHAAETKVMELDQMLLPAELDKVLDEVERRYLEAAYQRTNGSKKAAAELLGINFRSIRYRLDKYGIAKSDQE